MRETSSEVRAHFAEEHLRAHWAILFLYAAIALGLISIVSGLLQWQLIAQAQDGIPVTRAAALANDRRHLIVTWTRISFFLMSAIIFLRWLYRAYANLELMGSRRSENTPGWAIGYWFIPFLNLVKPYTIMKELWQRSHDGNRRNPDVTTAPASIGIWWMVYIVAGVVDRIAGMFSTSENSLDLLAYGTEVYAISNLLMVIAGILLVRLVKSIDRAQQSAAMVPTS